MENKGKTRRIKMTAWTAFMLPLMAMGMSLVAKGQSAFSEADHETVFREELCAATGPSTLFTGYAGYSVDYYEQPYFVGDYFRNLTEHFPTNNCGNCGYTAAAMLLCYYDTYWNGKIIDDHFNSDPAMIKDPKSTDYSSPGIKDFAAHIDEIKMEKPKDDAPQWEWDDYNSYLVDEIYGPYLGRMDEPYLLKTNLISYLYDLARGNNKKKMTLWNFGIKEPTTETNMTFVTNLLNLYFDEIGLTGLIEAKMVHYSTITLPQTNPSELMKRRAVRRAAIGRLLKGQPIIYRGDIATESGYYDESQNYVGNGHAAIAYGFDTKTNSIIGHIGWKGKVEYSQMNFDEVYGDLDGFIYFEVSPDLFFDHANVRFTDCSAYYPACDLFSHVHADDEHLAKVDYGDPEYHAVQCICGKTDYEMHDYHFGPLNNRKHGYKCACGDIIGEEDHTLTIERNPFYHTIRCFCGYENVGGHNFKRSGIMNFTCSDCGYSMPAGQFPNTIYNP